MGLTEKRTDGDDGTHGQRNEDDDGTNGRTEEDNGDGTNTTGLTDDICLYTYIPFWFIKGFIHW